MNLPFKLEKRIYKCLRFCLLISLLLTSCLPTELIKLASQYESNLIGLDQLQKAIRYELSLCDYKRKCFDKAVKELLEEKACVKGAYEYFGFISSKECEKAGTSMAEEIANLIIGEENTRTQGI